MWVDLVSDFDFYTVPGVDTSVGEGSEVLSGSESRQGTGLKLGPWSVPYRRTEVYVLKHSKGRIPQVAMGFYPSDSIKTPAPGQPYHNVFRGHTKSRSRLPGRS